MTIDEIAERLGIARTTIWSWVGHVAIPRKAHTSWPESARAKGNAAMQQKYRALREAAYAEGVASWPALSTDRSFRDFVCLYVAEATSADATRSPSRVDLDSSPRGVAQPGSAWPLGGQGRRFESGRPD
jgi:hypothetical protein